MNALRSSGVAAALVVQAARALSAQSTPVPLTPPLARGVMVRVVGGSGQEVTAVGHLVSIRADTVVILDSVQQTAGGRFSGYESRQRTFALDQKRQLYVLAGSRGHAGTGAAIGAGVGLAIGLVIGSGASDADSPGIGASMGVVFAIPGLLLGAVIGSVHTPIWVPATTSGVTITAGPAPVLRLGSIPGGIGLRLAF